MSVTTVVALIVFLTIPEVSVMGDPGVPGRCVCLSTEKRPIGRYIGHLEVKRANSNCKDIELIATLKETGEKICLDPEAAWVKKVLERSKQAAKKP